MSAHSSSTHASSSSFIVADSRMNARRNGVQYSPAQLRTLQSMTPSPAPLDPIHLPIGGSRSRSKRSSAGVLTIQVPGIARATSAQDSSAGQKRRVRARKANRTNRPFFATASPRLPPAPPSSPMVRPANSPSPHLIPSPPFALFRAGNNNLNHNANNAPGSIFSFQVSPALQQLRSHRRNQRSLSLPTLFRDDETKAETEGYSPTASSVKYSLERFTFENGHRSEEQDVKGEQPDGLLQPQVTIRAPRVSKLSASSVNSLQSFRPALTSPPLQAVLYSHLQHVGNRFQLEEKEQEQQQAESGKAPAEVQARRERRRAVWYSPGESQRLRETLASRIRQQHNPLVIFAAPSAHSRSPSMSTHASNGRVQFPDCWQGQLSADVSECEEGTQDQMDEPIELC